MKVYNTGIGILKVLAAFLVVDQHFGWTFNHGSSLTSVLTGAAVPVFVLLTFYFSVDAVLSRGILRRLWRFLSLLWGWGMLYALARIVLGPGVTLREVIGQLVFGSGLCNPLYYLMNVCVILVILRVASRFTSRKYLAVGLVAAVAVVLQYTNVNLRVCQFVFGDLWHCRPDEVTACGRILELLPAAACGLYLSRLDALSLSMRRLVAVMAVVLGVGLRFVILSPSGFGYQGISATLFAMGVVMLLKDLRWPREWEEPVRSLSSLMLGVYALHLFFGGFLGWTIGVKTGLVLSVLIFENALACSWVLSKVKCVRWLVA